MCKNSFIWVSIFSFIVMLFASPAPARAQDREGSMRYNAASKQMEFYDGTRWYNFGLGVALGVCDKPGAMEYEPLILISYQYCNGTNWVKIVGIPTLSLCNSNGAIDYRQSTFMVCNGLLWTNIKGAAASS